MFVYEVLFGEVEFNVVLVIIMEGMMLLLVNIDLVGVEVMLLMWVGCEYVFKCVLVKFFDWFDVVIIDCLLLLGVFIFNGLMVVDEVIVLL